MTEIIQAHFLRSTWQGALLISVSILSFILYKNIVHLSIEQKWMTLFDRL